MNTSLTACAVLSLAASVQAQYVVVSASGVAQATNPLGVPTQQTSTNPAGYHVHAQADNASAGAVFERSPNRLRVEMGVGSHESTPEDASSASASSTVTFATGVGYYVTLALAENNSLGSGSVHAQLVNAATHAFITTSGYLPPGQYRASADGGYSDGSGNASVDLTFSQPNTLCQYATAVGNGTYTGSTLHAIATGGAGASCGSSADSPAVWYRYTAPRSGTLGISTCGSSYDTVLSVYAATSCPTQAQQVACNDDGGGLGCSGLDSRVSLGVVSGGIYYIRVSGYNGAAGDYVLHIGPDNDQCTFASEIPGAGAYPFDNTFADTDGASMVECSNGGADPQVNGDLWYSFTPPTNGYLRFFTCEGTAWDTKLALYRGEVCLGEGQLLTCDDDGCGSAQPFRQSSVESPAVRGVPYYCRVGGYLTARGAGTLTVSFLPACATDFNNDGLVDFFDYDAFVGCYESGECPEGTSADFNNDGFADFFDYDDFVSAFESGAC